MRIFFKDPLTFLLISMKNLVMKLMKHQNTMEMCVQPRRRGQTQRISTASGCFGWQAWLVGLGRHSHQLDGTGDPGHAGSTGSRERRVGKPGWLVWARCTGAEKHGLAVWWTWERRDRCKQSPLCLAPRAGSTGSRERWVCKPGWLVWEDRVIHSHQVDGMGDPGHAGSTGSRERRVGNPGWLVWARCTGAEKHGLVGWLGKTESHTLARWMARGTQGMQGAQVQGRDGLASLAGWFGLGVQGLRNMAWLVGLGRQSHTLSPGGWRGGPRACREHRFKGETGWQAWLVGLG